MSKLATAWQRRPFAFALSLAGLTILGLLAMLADDGLWKLAGFALACLPFVFAGIGYGTQRRKRVSG